MVSPAHCATCSDEAIQGRVVQVTSEGMALVNLGKTDLEEVSLELVEAGPGDIVLVHAGVAIARLGASESLKEERCGR